MVVTNALCPPIVAAPRLWLPPPGDTGSGGPTPRELVLVGPASRCAPMLVARGLTRSSNLFRTAVGARRHRRCEPRPGGLEGSDAPIASARLGRAIR